MDLFEGSLFFGLALATIIDNIFRIPQIIKLKISMEDLCVQFDTLKLNSDKAMVKSLEKDGRVCLTRIHYSLLYSIQIQQKK